MRAGLIAVGGLGAMIKKGMKETVFSHAGMESASVELRIKRIHARRDQACGVQVSDEIQIQSVYLTFPILTMPMSERRAHLMCGTSELEFNVAGCTHRDYHHHSHIDEDVCSK